MTDFNQFINEHLVKRITVGQGGAEVYELENEQIAKHVRRKALESDELWESYKREYEFYSYFKSSKLPMLPQIYYTDMSDDEICVIMRKYSPLKRSELSDGLLDRIMSTLADIHRLSIPDFIPQNEITPLRLGDSDLKEYSLGWTSVLKEHGQTFDVRITDRIAENINRINEKLFNPKRTLSHGDFHFDNLLEDECGNIIVCDWQGVNIGHVSGDISFLLSRLSGDGYGTDKEKAAELYCKHSDTDNTPDEIISQMSLANLNTSFMFWHNYLYGSSEDRVRSVFDKMVEDFELLFKT